MKKITLVLVTAFLLLASAATAIADRRPVPAGISDTTFELDATDSGWYTDAGNHLPHITNYVAGECYLPQCAQVVRYRNFFVFDLSAVSGKVAAASLKIENPPDGYNSADLVENWTAFKVTTPISTLVTGGSGLTGVYDDLGSGPVYGSAEYASGYTTVDIPLTGYGIHELNQAAGGLFAVGGAITTLDEVAGSEWLFGDSDDTYIRKLFVRTFEPSDLVYIPAVIK